jgi:hypothetical protein
MLRKAPVVPRVRLEASITDPFPGAAQPVKLRPLTASGRSSSSEIPPRAERPERTETPENVAWSDCVAMAVKWASPPLLQALAHDRFTARRPYRDQRAPPATVALQARKVTEEMEEPASLFDRQMAPPFPDERSEKKQFATVTQGEGSMWGRLVDA